MLLKNLISYTATIILAIKSNNSSNCHTVYMLDNEYVKVVAELYNYRKENL